MLLGGITKIVKIKVSSSMHEFSPQWNPTTQEVYNLRLTADSAGLFVSPPTESKACLRLYRSKSK